MFVRLFGPMVAILSTMGCGAGAPSTADIDAARGEIPDGSADYASPLADATLYRKGAISFDELTARVVARHLPPHPLGDAYLFVTPPPPPPGMGFEPKSMPSDWKGTFGEIAMTHFASKITKDEFDRLHAAAHPDCKKVQ